MEPKITTCLWFNNNEAEAAAAHYVAIFNNAPVNASHPASRILSRTRYLEAGREHHRQEPGSTMTVAFTLRGQPFVALNGGSQGWSFSPAVSFMISCADQTEVDYFWEKLREGGDKEQERCGWLADRFGVSWQVVPVSLIEMLGSGDEGCVSRVTAEMMGQTKLDIAALEKAFRGE